MKTVKLTAYLNIEDDALDEIKKIQHHAEYFFNLEEYSKEIESVYGITIEEDSNASNKNIVKTPYGYFDISVSEDENYPGVDVEFVHNNDKGEHASRPRVLFELPKGEDLRVLIWEEKDSEDYTKEIIFDGYNDIVCEEANVFVRNIINKGYFDVHSFLSYMREMGLISYSDLSTKMTVHLLNDVSSKAHDIDSFITLVSEATYLARKNVAVFKGQNTSNESIETATNEGDISSTLSAVQKALGNAFSGASAPYTYFEAFDCTEEEVAEALAKTTLQFRGFDIATIEGADNDKENIFSFVIHCAYPSLAKEISSHLPGKVIVGYTDWDYFGIEVYKNGDVAVPGKDFCFSSHSETSESDEEAIEFAYRISVGDIISYGSSGMVYENDVNAVKEALTHKTI